jgi:hypothetical protein
MLGCGRHTKLLPDSTEEIHGWDLAEEGTDLSSSKSGGPIFILSQVPADLFFC